MRVRGYILIELVVTCALISVIAGIGVVSFNNYKEGMNRIEVEREAQALVTFLSDARQDCINKQVNGTIQVDVVGDRLLYSRNTDGVGRIREIYEFSDGFKLDRCTVSTGSNRITINSQGRMSGCTIYFTDKEGKEYGVAIAAITGNINVKI